MAGNFLEVDGPEALAQALATLQSGSFLAYKPVGGEQVSLLAVKNRMAYYCDLHRRPPTDTTRQAVESVGLKMQDINAIQRRADLMGGMVPTISFLTSDEAMSHLEQAMAEPMATAGAAVPAGTRLSRMVDTLFGKKTTPEAGETPGNTPPLKKQKK